MSATLVWIPAVFLSFLMLHNAAAQSQMYEEPFKAALMLITNVTYPASSNMLDPEHVYYREVLRFTEEQIDEEREAALQFYSNFYGLNFTGVEPDEYGQRVLGNATFRPVMSTFNSTFVFNRWLVRGKTDTRHYRVGDGGFEVRFSGPVMLHGEYGGEEGKPVSANEGLYYGHDYIYDACRLQGIIFQIESLTPIRRVQPDGWYVITFRVRNRTLGEGTSWGVVRITEIDSDTVRFEGRQLYTFP